MNRHLQKIEKQLRCRLCHVAIYHRSSAAAAGLFNCMPLPAAFSSLPRQVAFESYQSASDGNAECRELLSKSTASLQPTTYISTYSQRHARTLSRWTAAHSSQANIARSPGHAHRCCSTAAAAAEAPHVSSAASAAASQRLSPSETHRGHLHQETLLGGMDKVRLKAQVVFDACWRKLESQATAPLQAPAEIVWLNGAPGSGKGANTPYIMESRGIATAITMSSLLDSSEEIRELKNRGDLIPDTVVGDALLTTIFQAGAASGAGILIDGFPRTALQVDFLKLLYDKLLSLHIEVADTPDEPRFPRPSFKVVVLYVDQEESVRRQMARAKMAALHNLRAKDAGTEDLMRHLRSTDVDEAKCRARYAVFKEHYGTLLRLKQAFPFSLIDAMGDLTTCRAQIQRELRYQSSLDLNPLTHSAIRHLPLARDLVRVARQQLVRRLDGYMSKKNAPTFRRVLDLIDREVVPLLRKCSLAGHAEYKTQDKVFIEHSEAPDMLLDVLSDRGFSGSHIMNERIVPARVDPETWEIVNQIDKINKFRITFLKHGVREKDASPPVVAAEEQAIGHTYLPGHMADTPEHLERATPSLHSERSGDGPLGDSYKPSRGIDATHPTAPPSASPSSSATAAAAAAASPSSASSPEVTADAVVRHQMVEEAKQDHFNEV